MQGITADKEAYIEEKMKQFKLVDMRNCYEDIIAEAEEEYTRRIDAWIILAEGDKEWQITSEQHNSNTRENAGASRSLGRVDCTIKKGRPFYIRTNVETVEVNLFSLKENKNSTRKKDLKMNQQDVQLVEKLRNNKIIEDNYKVCFLRAIEVFYSSFNAKNLATYH